MKLSSAVFGLALSILSLQAMADTAPAQDPTKEAAAERYFATQDIDVDINNVVNSLGNMIQNPAVTQEQKKQFVGYARDHLDRVALKNAMIQAMMETYTTDELNGLADFYSSPVGKSVMAKAPAFNAAARRYTVPIAMMFLGSYAKDCTDQSKCLPLAMMMPVAPAVVPGTLPAVK
jgi:hypothetical protein